MPFLQYRHFPRVHVLISSLSLCHSGKFEQFDVVSFVHIILSGIATLSLTYLTFSCVSVFLALIQVTTQNIGYDTIVYQFMIIVTFR